MLFRLLATTQAIQLFSRLFLDPIPKGIAETILGAATRVIVISFLHHSGFALSSNPDLLRGTVQVLRAGPASFSGLKNSTCAFSEGCSKHKELLEMKTNR